MKKLITIALVVLCISTIMLVLASCGEHEHSFNTESWEKDEQNHWHKCVAEGEECSETMDKEAHTFVEKEGSKVSATCEEDGSVIYVCSICGYEKAPEVIKALGHDAQETVVKPTCTKDGFTKVTCKRDGCSYFLNKDIVPAQHNLREEVIAPTCTEGGITKVECKVKNCGYSDEINPTEPLGHDKSENVIKPTCTEEGYTEVTCSRCDFNEIINRKAVMPHSYEENIVKPTCTEGGYSAKTCTECGATTEKTGITDALGHDYIEGTLVEPTCRHGGYIPVTCSRCDYSGKKDETPSLGHSYNVSEEGKERVDYIIVTKPTCDVEGEKVFKCTRCNDFPKEEDKKNVMPIPALGHDEQYEVIAPTCTQKGATVVTCSRCNFKENRDEVPAVGHTYYKNENAQLDVHYKITLEPSCTEEGVKSYICQAGGCGLLATDDETGKEAIPAYPEHSWAVSVEPWCGNDSCFEYYCDRVANNEPCTATKTEKATEEVKHTYAEDKLLIKATCVEYATYECPVCEKTFVAYEGDEFGQPTGAHVYDIKMDVVPSTCIDKGYTIYGCSAGECGLTDKRDYTEIAAHKLGQVSDYGTVTCDTCGKSYVDVTAEKASDSEAICICGQDPCICNGTITGWEGYAKPKEPMNVTANETFTITEVVWADGTHPLAIGGGIIVLGSEEGAEITVVIYAQDGAEALHTFNVTGNYAMLDLSEYESVGKVEITSTADATVSFYSVI